MKHDDVETITQVYHSHFTNAASKYYVGIIDILQKWTWEKKLERWAKAFMGQDLDGVSAIEPDPYRQRFCEAVQGCVRYCFPVPSLPSPSLSHSLMLCVLKLTQQCTRPPSPLRCLQAHL
jgi:hypothetical protein